MIGIRKTEEKKIKTGKYTGKKIKKKTETESVNIVDSSFSDALKQVTLSEAESSSIEDIQKLVSEIDKQGRQFAEHPILEELIKYKNLIQQFLKKAVKDTYTVEVQHGIKRGIREANTYRIVKIINEKTDSLTQLILNGAKKNIQIIQRLDEIRGLLIDLYK